MKSKLFRRMSALTLAFVMAACEVGGTVAVYELNR